MNLYCTLEPCLLADSWWKVRFCFPSYISGIYSLDGVDVQRILQGAGVTKPWKRDCQTSWGTTAGQIILYEKNQWKVFHSRIFVYPRLRRMWLFPGNFSKNYFLNDITIPQSIFAEQLIFGLLSSVTIVSLSQKIEFKETSCLRPLASASNGRAWPYFSA